jgi:hypothetical protein
MRIEEYWWPEECLYSVKKFPKKNGPKRGERKKKRESERVASPGGSIGEEAPALPPLQAHEPLEAHEPAGYNLQWLQPIGLQPIDLQAASLQATGP